MLEKADVLLPLPCLLWLALPCQGNCTHQNRLVPGRQSQNSPHTIQVSQRQNKKPDYLLRLNAASRRPQTSLLTADHQELHTSPSPPGPGLQSALWLLIFHTVFQQAFQARRKLMCFTTGLKNNAGKTMQEL